MEIHWVNPGLFRDSERSLVEARIRELTQGRSDVIDVRIAARPSGHHRHGGQEVHITCEARGRQIVAARARPDAGLALNEAIDVFERELLRLRDRRSGQRAEREHHAPPPELGVIDRVVSDEDHGFILTDAGERVYFHRNALQGALDFERLEEGQRVGLNVEGGEKGLQATVVRPAPPDTV
jgi:cold shock CspA family protein/ribosome-associated translation inhibitor RaiA